MTDFDKYILNLQLALKDFAEVSWKDFREAAISDAQGFLDASKEDLNRWTRALAKGDLSKDDFEWLVESKKDLATLFALKQIGLKKIALDRFLNGVIDLIVDTAFKTFL